MRKAAYCLLAALAATAGCMDTHGFLGGQSSAKNAPVAQAPAPTPPPVTEDQVTEANASAAVHALTDELNREASR